MIDEDSLKEALIRRRRREQLTRLYDQDKLPFRKSYNLDHQCSRCPMRPVEGSPASRADGTWYVPVYSVEFLDIDEERVCRPCFLRDYYIHPPTGELGMDTSSTPSTPRSQRDYDGGAFHRGEW